MMNNTVRTFTSLVLSLVLLCPGYVIAGDKSLLSEAIAKAIESKGVTVATKEFASNYEKDKNRYTVDMNGVFGLVQKYTQANNIEAAQTMGLSVFGG